MGAYIPPGWPAGVHPPGSEDFESTAIGWLLDVVPPDYRLHGVLRRYPVALAALARYHSKACVEGARQGYRTARTELAGVLPPHAIDTVLAAYRKEGARLAATAEAVDLVERALRGEEFTPRMSLPSAAPERQSPEPEGAEPERTEPGRTEPGRTEPGRTEPGRTEPGGTWWNPVEPRRTLNMDLSLTDKIAIVTGSSRGLGLASARGLVAEGCRVCICARGPEQLAAAAI